MVYVIYPVGGGDIVSVANNPKTEDIMPEGLTQRAYDGPRESLRDMRVTKDGRLVAKSRSQTEQEKLAQAWQALRYKRFALLERSDWTQVADAPVNQAAWKVYRQALRDMPANTTDPASPVWPAKPGDDT